MMHEIQTIPLKVPCYLVKTSSGFFLIDTGDSSDCANLEKELGQAGVTPENLKLVLLTHGDFDHTGNAAFLQQKYGAKIAMHAEGRGNGKTRGSRLEPESAFGSCHFFWKNHHFRLIAICETGQFQTI